MINFPPTPTEDAVYVSAKQRLQSRLYDARNEVQRREQDVVRLAESVEERAQRVRRYVASGSSLNELGELQATGLALDVAVAALCAARRRHEELRMLASEFDVKEEV